MRDRDDVLVRNAADPAQVQRGSRRMRGRRRRELDDLRAVLAEPAGRRVVWRLLEHCAVFRSIWDPSVRIHVNAGRQDVGHWLMAEIEQADDHMVFRMMHEARTQARQEAEENSAARTPSATVTETTTESA